MAASPPPNDTLLQLVELLGEDNTRDLVRTFLREYDGLIRAISTADPPGQHRAVHSLKSSSRHMGLMALGRRLETLELRVLTPGGAVTAADLATLHHEFEQQAPSLRQFVVSE